MLFNFFKEKNESKILSTIFYPIYTTRAVARLGGGEGLLSKKISPTRGEKQQVLCSPALHLGLSKSPDAGHVYILFWATYSSGLTRICRIHITVTVRQARRTGLHVCVQQSSLPFCTVLL